MKIDGKEYRIKETTYKDGRKEYVAEYAAKFLWFKIWKKYVLRYTICYDNIYPIYCEDITYEGCYGSLIDSIDADKKSKEARTKVKTNYYF